MKTILYIVGIYFLYQIVKGLFTAKKVVNNINDAARQQYERQQQQNNRANQPEQESVKRPTDSIGDYVDYEEVEDDK